MLSCNLNNTINKLQARAGLPDMTTTPADDPANNMGVSNLIWEIRRCRRCELMFDNWYRYWDLIRWHQLELLDSKKHPNVFLGANLENVANPEETLKNALCSLDKIRLLFRFLYDAKQICTNRFILMNESMEHISKQLN